MVSLPPLKAFDAIMVVVDQFSKMAHFILTKDEAMAQETGRLFLSHIFKHHGLPKDIMSDRDPKFTSKFWWALWKRMGSELKMNTSFRPQTDGQTERVNLVIQQFLRNYVAADQQDWVDHLELAEIGWTTSSTPLYPPFSVGSWERPSSPNFPQLNIVGPSNGFNPGLGSASKNVQTTY